MRSSTISRSVVSSVWKFSKLERDIKIEEPGWQLWGRSSSNKVCWKPGHLDIFLWLAVVACPASAIPLSGCPPCPLSPDFQNSEFSISKYLWNIIFFFSKYLWNIVYDFSKFLWNLLSQSLNFYEMFCLFLPARPQPPNQLFWTKYLSCPLGARKIKPAPPCWYYVILLHLILFVTYRTKISLVSPFSLPSSFHCRHHQLLFHFQLVSQQYAHLQSLNLVYWQKHFQPSNSKHHRKRVLRSH